MSSRLNLRNLFPKLRVAHPGPPRAAARVVSLALVAMGLAWVSAASAAADNWSPVGDQRRVLRVLEGPDGNLWEAMRHAGSVLGEPFDLGMGPLGSEPTALVRRTREALGVTYLRWANSAWRHPRSIAICVR